MGKNRLLIVFTIIVSIVLTQALTGCSVQKPWFTPHSPEVDAKGQWQIQGYHLRIDSPKKFTFEIGLAEKTADYSFWLNKLSWREITASEAQTLFGKTTTEKLLLTHNSGNNSKLYDLVMPNTLDTDMPATKLGYGKGDPGNLADSVVSLREGDSEHLFIIANNPLQWTGTSVDPEAQTVSFTFLPAQ